MNYMTDEELRANKDPAVLTSEAEYQERAAICGACEQKDVDQGFDICKMSDCQLGFKLVFKLAPCRLNKWVLDPAILPKVDNVSFN